MLVQVPSFLVRKFHDWSNKICTTSELRTTEHSDFDRSVHLVVTPKVGPFFSRFFRSRSGTRSFRNFCTIFFPMFCKIDFDEITGTSCKRSPVAINFSKGFYPLGPMSWRLPQNYFVSLFAPSLFRMLERTLSSKFAIPFFIKRTLRWMPVITFLTRRSMLARLFPVGVLLSKEFRRGELNGREPFSFSLGFSFILWILFHTYLSAQSIDLLLSVGPNIHCLINLSLRNLRLATAATDAGFSSCLSREEKCFSRNFCSRYQTPSKKSGIFSRFTFVNSILSVHRQQWLVLF